MNDLIVKPTIKKDKDIIFIEKTSFNSEFEYGEGYHRLLSKLQKGIYQHIDLWKEFAKLDKSDDYFNKKKNTELFYKLKNLIEKDKFLVCKAKRNKEGIKLISIIVVTSRTYKKLYKDFIREYGTLFQTYEKLTRGKKIEMSTLFKLLKCNLPDRFIIANSEVAMEKEGNILKSEYTRVRNQAISYLIQSNKWNGNEYEQRRVKVRSMKFGQNPFYELPSYETRTVIIANHSKEKVIEILKEAVKEEGNLTEGEYFTQWAKQLLEQSEWFENEICDKIKRSEKNAMQISRQTVQ